MHDAMMPQVLAGARQSGKTTEMIKWLMRGHPTEERPCWSRIILTPDKNAPDRLLQQFPEADAELRAHGIADGLLDLVEVWTKDPYRGHGRWMGRHRNGPEVALDDAELLLLLALGFRPSVLTMTGTAYEAEEKKPIIEITGPLEPFTW